MIRKPAQDGAKYFLDSPVFGVKRSPQNKQDFGDPETVGLCLKRVGLHLGSTDYSEDESFGKFLGEHPDGWVVAMDKLDWSGCSGCEVFPSLEALKQRWELD